VTRLSVIGTGYLGATHAACMASLGHDVVAFDLDSEKIGKFSSGNLPFFEPGLADLLKAGIKSGKLRFTNELADAISNSEVHFICVGTPQVSESGAADLSQIHSAVKAMAPLLSEGSTVVGKSTVPVGTASWVNQYFSEHAAQNVKLVWNPEFLREGFAVKDTLHPDRIVLGVSNDSDSSVLEKIYSSTIESGTPVIITDYATAELVKVAANAFLATKISFINAFADLCDVVGADVTTLADAIGHDTRIGRRFLNAGIGFGGGCLPKDIRALQARANELGMKDQFEFLNQIDHINKGRRSYLVQKVEIELGDVKSKNVAILGVAFKPDSDDIRDSPAISIAKRLIELGANVTVHDPEALQILSKIHPEIKSSNKVEDALANADLVLHLTEWQQYRELDLTELSKLVKTRTIIDGRNILDRATWNSAGWKIIYLGRPSS
jgi:UDPglucose 6-dehydrogenase